MQGYHDQLRDYFSSHIIDYPKFQGSFVTYANTRLFVTVSTYETVMKLGSDTVQSLIYKDAASLTIEDPYELPYRTDGSDYGQDMRRGNVLRLNASNGSFIKSWNIPGYSINDITSILEEIFPFGDKLRRLLDSENVRRQAEDDKKPMEAAQRQQVEDVIFPLLMRFLDDASTRLHTRFGQNLGQGVLDLVISCINEKLTYSAISRSLAISRTNVRSDFDSMRCPTIESLDRMLSKHLNIPC